MTLDPTYSSLCGYTDDELDSIFETDLVGLDRDEIREWYNGYNWLGSENVYNPHNILSLLKSRKIDSWWYETSTPAFLFDVLRKANLYSIDLHKSISSSSLLKSFEVDEIDANALLFQTGYLTVTGVEGAGTDIIYHLDYPNREVRESLHRSLLDSLLPEQNTKNAARRNSLRACLATGDFEGLKNILQSVLAGIPYSWHTRGNLAKYEAYFSSVIYSFFIGSAVRPYVEDTTSRGRIELTVEENQNVYIFEFKVLNGSKEGEALAQIKDNGYADKYRHTGKQIYLIGAEFSSEDRTLARFDVEPA